MDGSVGMLLIGGLLIRYGGLYGIEGWLPRQIPFATDLACLAVLFAAAAVAVYRKIVTRIIGGVIRNDLFLRNSGSRSVFFRRLYISC